MHTFILSLLHTFYLSISLSLSITHNLNLSLTNRHTLTPRHWWTHTVYLSMSLFLTHALYVVFNHSAHANIGTFWLLHTHTALSTRRPTFLPTLSSSYTLTHIHTTFDIPTYYTLFLIYTHPPTHTRSAAIEHAVGFPILQSCTLGLLHSLSPRTEN